MAKVTSTRYNVRRAKGVGLGLRAGDDDKEGEGEGERCLAGGTVLK